MENSQTNPFGSSLTLATKYESAKQGAHLIKKGYLPNCTEELFTITKRVLRRPPV